MDKIIVLNNKIGFYNYKEEDFISLTDIAKYKDYERSDYIIQNWLRNKNTLEFLGFWEKINNPNFNSIEFDGFRNKSGLNSFSITPKQWTEKTLSKGIISKQGKNGGTYAHKDIAFEFASWISVEFKLFLIKEFQRLKEEENNKNNLDWDIKRNLAAINYHVHTDAIKKHLIPEKISVNEKNIVYATEADILNLALFAKTAKEWKKENPNMNGNLRDYADITQLICLSNLENLNAHFIKEGLNKSERLRKLNCIAIEQMTILSKSREVKKLSKKEHK